MDPRMSHIEFPSCKYITKFVINSQKLDNIIHSSSLKLKNLASRSPFFCFSDTDDLKEILLSVEPRLQPIPLIRRHVSRFVDGADMDEVLPNLWLGDW